MSQSGVGRVALVTGANRGIGREVARQLAARGHVTILGSRDALKGQAAAQELRGVGVEVIPRQLDITDPSSVDALAAYLDANFGRLDILVNNAAIHYDTWQRASTADLGVVTEALDTNVLGAWRVAQACADLLRASGDGRIVNVSSTSGSLSTMGAATPAYSASKAALNALTRLLAAELYGDGILVNSVCPGWVATDMGGPGGRPVSHGAAGVVWAATLPADGPTGGFYQDGQPVAW
jgi:NAD(P)-dependent dehydrogenase (short-subunit alcohol dehydrogenase family)